MSGLVLPEGMPACIATEARVAGADIVETGGFILGPANAPASVLAVTGDKGITRRRDLFHVGGRALVTLFDWAEARELNVTALWHTHRGRAFLSDTDRKHGFNVPGFCTTVLPDYERASADPAEWGWWTFTGSEWVDTNAPAVVRSGFSVITFEEDDVHEY